MVTLSEIEERIVRLHKEGKNIKKMQRLCTRIILSENSL